MPGTNRENPNQGRVYDKEGLAPTLSCMGGGNREPMIIEDFYKNRELRVYDETSPTLRAEREGLKVIVASRGRNPDNPSDRTPGNYVEQRLEPNSEGICNTLTSVQKDNLVLEQNKTYLENAIEQIIEKNNGKIPEAWDLYNKNPINNGISKALSTDCGHTGTAGATAVTHNYRIRKLTPKECWRLMAFTDEDFHKAEKVNSNTQLYKQAGNSICVNVLESIFKNLLNVGRRNNE